MKNKLKYNILVVDDDQPLNAMICKFLEKQGLTNVKAFYTGEELLNNIKKYDSPIIIQDYELPGINGVEILKKVKSIKPNAEFIFLSGQSSIDVAIDSIKLGAFDYIIKDNFAKENVMTKIRNLIKIKQLLRERSIFKVVISAFLLLLLISWIYFLLNKLDINLL